MFYLSIILLIPIDMVMLIYIVKQHANIGHDI